MTMMTGPRPEPSPTADERATLDGFLDWQRGTIVLKCAGLNDDQLRLRAVPSSNLTLLGLMRHLAAVERWWPQTVIAGESRPELYTATDDEDEDFNDLNTATGETTLAVWRAEVDQSRRSIAEYPLVATGVHPDTGVEYSLRWVLNHMIEEYARHNGHADLIREAIDGEVGE